MKMDENGVLELGLLSNYIIDFYIEHLGLLEHGLVIFRGILG